jgi:hypothetical protein
MQTIPEAQPAPPPVRSAQPPSARHHAPTARRAEADRPRAVSIIPAPPPPVSATPQAIAAAAPATSTPLSAAPTTPFVQPLPLTPPSDPRLAALQRTLADETAKASRLSVPPVVSQGGPGQVSLRLPATLLARLQSQAKRFDLGRAAQTAEVSARLSGEGYQITPSEAQTAALKPGEELVFNWQVAPAATTAGAKPAAPGPLKAEAEAALTGQGQALTFPLTALEHAPATAAEPARSREENSAKWLLASILVLLAALVLGGVFRNHRERQRLEAERRRREAAAAAFDGPRPLSEAEAAAFAESPVKP